ncbi:hypothetical protein MMC30_006699 [Trapelia coarctata]|nr:hypothetical protein [Trapelia coarctata]
MEPLFALFRQMQTSEASGTTQVPKPYRYIPLTHPDEIRLIRFVGPGCTAGQAGGNAVIEIYSTRLDSSPVYRALSYTWGAASGTVPVTSDQHGNYIGVTPNCAAALHRLYEDDKETPMWIDAISIDQENLAERSHQVSIMREIYRAAQNVMIFLGEGDADSALAMQYIIDFNKGGRKGRVEFSNSYQAANPPPADLSSEVPNALRNLFKRPWFERVWVIQEANWAKTAEVLCGEYKAAWMDMKYACQAIMLQRKFGIKNAFDPPPILGFILSVSMVHHFDTPGNLLQRLHETRSYKATDPRDKVFALLATGFAYEGKASIPQSRSAQQTIERVRAQRQAMRSTPSIVPDYCKPTSEVYTDMAKDLITRDKNLDVLCGVQGPSEIPNLPSWVPDWSVPSQREVIGTSANKSRYNASGDQLIHAGLSSNQSVPAEVSANGRTLTVHGIIFDTITKLSDPYLAGKTPNSLIQVWEQSVKHLDPYLTGESIGTVFLETIIACRLAHNESARWLQHAPLWRKHWFDDGETAWDKSNQPQPGAPLYGAWQFGEQVKKACSGRKLLGTTNGCIGLAPSGAEIGDGVAILLGGQLPFIIRPAGDGRYTLVGESYLGGLMDGKGMMNKDGSGKDVRALIIQ